MKSAFVLQHLHSLSDDRESVKMIGLYASMHDALKAIDRLCGLPGFSDYPNLINPLIDDEESGFYIDEYELGKDNWADGYTTV
jgi:hypothetical protein